MPIQFNSPAISAGVIRNATFQPVRPITVDKAIAATQPTTQSPSTQAAGDKAAATQPVTNAQAVQPAAIKLALATPQPSLAARIDAARFVDPNLVRAIDNIGGGSGAGIPRDKVTAPICPGYDLTDDAIWQDPKDANKSYYLPHFRIAQGVSSNQPEYRILFGHDGAGATESFTLTVWLEQYPSSAVPSGSTAQPITPSLTILLRHLIDPRGAATRDWEFGELSADGANTKAILRFTRIQDRDQIYQAMTNSQFNPQLIVRRVTEVAIELRPTALPHRPIFFMRRFGPGIGGGDGGGNPPPQQDLYQQDAHPFDDTLPFYFDKDLHKTIYSDVQGVTQQAFGLNRIPVTVQGSVFNYYQDQANPKIFYYVPDCFKIARRPDAPHLPWVSVDFTGDTLDSVQATLSYYAVPVVDVNRLLASTDALKGYVADGSAPTVAPLQSSGARFSVAYPGADTSAGPFQQRTGAQVSLASGIADSLTLAIGPFKQLYGSMFSASSVLFRGLVEVNVDGGGDEQVPLIAKMNDLSGHVLDCTPTYDPVSGGFAIALQNAIESPVVVSKLGVTLYRANDVVPSNVQGLDLSQPQTLQPGDALHFTLAPKPPYVANDTPLSPVFDTSGVTVQPDQQAILQAIVDQSVGVRATKQVVVKMAKSQFTAAAGSTPDQQLQAVDVNFEKGTVAIEFTAGGVQVNPTDGGASLTDPDPTILSAQIKVPIPLVNYVLDEDNAGQYHYAVSIINKKGARTDGSQQSASDPILWPSLPTPSTNTTVDNTANPTTSTGGAH